MNSKVSEFIKEVYQALKQLPYHNCTTVEDLKKALKTRLEEKESRWNPLIGYLRFDDDGEEQNELARQDPITAEYERARTTVGFEIDVSDGCSTKANSRKTCTNYEGKGCELCLGTGCANSL